MWSGAAGVVVLLAMVKGWVIVDGFMELRHGPWKWRVAMLGWGLVVLAGIVGLSA
ncbi:cytochrome C oxidase subunit IV family protein [Pseudomonas rhodesiae]|uniref:cytochrome C oxidase subunit IV family protein n=1 Tax=Pseudomonas rhodesiae TaxID=76760 RepID=UPI002FCDB1BE